MSTTTEIGEYDPEAAAEHEARKTVSTADELRTTAVGNALDCAYAKASTLQLSTEEATALSADFPDEAFRTGAQGKANLIYIEHAFLRERLNTVLGIGSATPIRRSTWSERFTYRDRDNKEREGVTIYVELVLVVRGCVVSEAIGDATYYPHNDATSYSDALESAKSAAFRRCAKEFGVGLQAWKKGWVEGWHQRNRNGNRPQQSKVSKPSQKPPVKETATFEPPKDWPDTAIHDINLWVESFATSAQFKAALGMFLNEPAIVGSPADWEPILRHFAATYKVKYQAVGTAELNSVIKAALDKMEADKAEAAAMDKEAAQAAAG